MQSYLLFRLYGPMAAWGDTAVGEFRPSHDHPTRTATLGLVAAALGIRRDQEETLLSLDRSINVAIRLDAPGEVLRDYHTTQVPPTQRKVTHYTRQDELNAGKLHTILSSRDYRCDCAATIALGCKKNRDFSLNEISEALAYPKLPLYLGRKSCPLSLPLAAKIIDANGLTEAFDQYPEPQSQLDTLTDGLWGFGGLNKEKVTRLYWDSDEADLSPEMTFPRRDRLRSRRRWQFDERIEYMTTQSATED